MIELLKQNLRRIGPARRAVARFRGARIHEPAARSVKIEVLGSDYGGWGLNLAPIGRDSIVYGVGVGEDVTFDLALIARKGCAVFAFDPTPRSVAWIAGQDLPPEFHFHQIGLGAEDGEVDFHEPVQQEHVSYSRQGGDGRATVRCPIRRLETLMRQLGHERIDVLKIDIEGFEYEVIQDMIRCGIRPGQLLVEFHHGMYGHEAGETRAAVDRLRAYGYEIAWVSDSGHEYNLTDVRRAN